MKTIHKYIIDITDEQLIQIPEEAEILHAGLDPRGYPCLWARVDTDKPFESVKIIVAGTGNPLPEVGRHLGSFTQNFFVWHVFTGPELICETCGGPRPAFMSVCPPCNLKRLHEKYPLP
jgi:hypothetical protein